MLTKVCNLWSEPAEARCITTNGFIKKNGSLVMGAGVAGQAQERYPNFPKIAGAEVSADGNHVHFYGNWFLRGFTKENYTSEPLCYYVTFPVKHNWYEKADLDLIKRSATELQKLVEIMGWQKVLLPCPGCGNGQLSWSEVEPVIAPILDDRVIVIDNSFPGQFDLAL